MKTILKNHSILFVEDELEVQAQIKEYLEHYFKDVYVASDGKEALELYKRYLPDALLLDINLPLVDGLTIAKEVRERNKNIKIIMLTAYTDEEKLLNAVELKLTKYLVKPVTPKEFKKALELLAKELLEVTDELISLDEHHIWSKSTKQLLHIDQEIKLTQKVRLLLSLLVEKRGFCVTYADIMAYVWEDEFDKEISIDSVKAQVSLLRKKLPENIIENVYGKGYIIR